MPKVEGRHRLFARIYPEYRYEDAELNMDRRKNHRNPEMTVTWHIPEPSRPDCKWDGQIHPNNGS